MTRGNQREVSRAKNMKKQQEMAKKKPSGGDGLTLEQRKHRDAELMREKQKKKEAPNAQNASNKQGMPPDPANFRAIWFRPDRPGSGSRISNNTRSN